MRAYGFDPAVQEAMQLVFLGVQPKTFDGVQETDKRGVPRWAVGVTDVRGESFSISLSSPTQPEVARFAPIVFSGLQCGAGKSGLWWAATAIAAVGEPVR